MSDDHYTGPEIGYPGPSDARFEVIDYTPGTQVVTTSTRMAVADDQGAVPLGLQHAGKLVFIEEHDGRVFVTFAPPAPPSTS